MTENNSRSEGKSPNSTKRLVKILVIIGIGIPVLVELMTLFNLFNVQLFKDEQEMSEQPESVVEVRQITERDTIFRDYRFPIVVDLLRINVSAQQWRFELGLAFSDSLSQDHLQIEVDSIKLNSGIILSAEEKKSWEIQESPTHRIQTEWVLPNGDIPRIMYISSSQQQQENSAKRVQQEIPLGKIPVRYTRE